MKKWWLGSIPCTFISKPMLFRHQEHKYNAVWVRCIAGHNYIVPIFTCGVSILYRSEVCIKSMLCKQVPNLNIISIFNAHFSMDRKLVGVVCTNQLPTNSHLELEDSSISYCCSLTLSFNYSILGLRRQCLHISSGQSFYEFRHKWMRGKAYWFYL